MSRFQHRFVVFAVLVPLLLFSRVAVAGDNADSPSCFGLNPQHTNKIDINNLSFPISVKWSEPLDIVSLPVNGAGLVFVITVPYPLSYMESLYALDAKTGNVVWGPVSVEQSASNLSSPVCYDHGRVFVATYSTFDENQVGIEALNAKTGKSAWTRKYKTLGPISGPIIPYDGLLYFGLDTYSGINKLVALRESDGSSQFSISISDSDAQPTIANNLIFESGGTSYAAAYNRKTGVRSWMFEAGSPDDTVNLAYSDGLLLLSDGYTERTLDAGSGLSISDIPSLSPSVVDGNTAIGQSLTGYIGIDLRSQKLLWSLPLTYPPTTQPIEVNNDLIFQDTLDNLNIIDVSTRHQTQTISTIGSLVTSITAGQGHVFLTTSGALIALGS